MKTAHFPRICLARRAALALSLTTLPALSFAQGLPQLENPSRGTGGGTCGRSASWTCSWASERC